VVGEGLAEGAEQVFQTVPVGARQRPLGGARHLFHGQPQQFVDQGVLAAEAGMRTGIS
jgi:hypothetical protein